MSQLIDKLKQASQAIPQPIGFRAVHPVSQQPALLLIARLAKTDAVADYLTGADGGLLYIRKSSEIKALQEASKAVPEIPLGAWLRDSAQTEIEEIVKSGCDFIIFPADKTTLALPKNETVGRILEIEASLSNGLLIAINELTVDGVVVTGKSTEGDFLTWHHLMLYQHFTALLTKPLLVPVPSNVTASELQSLWEVGVDGVIIDAEAGKLAELRAAIDKLTFPQRKRRTTEALIPRVGPQMIVEEEEEEEEEEE